MGTRARDSINDGYEVVPTSRLKHHPRNPRRGDVDRIAESMDVNGVFGALVVQRSTCHVLAGNHRLKAARKLGIPTLPVTWVDVDDATAHRILLADNRTSDLGSYDDTQLAELLQALEHDGGLLGTGYTGDDLAALLAGLEPSEEVARAEDAGEIDGGLGAEIAEKWGVRPGQVWRAGDLTLHVADYRSVDAAFDALFWDPPWDAGLVPPDATSVLAFCDGARAGDVVDLFGAPAWVFVWDGVSSWWTPNRPLRRGKLCLWYGDVTTYNPDGSHYGEPDEARTVTNTRGTYDYTPDPRGKHLSDVFSAPLTKLHSEDGAHKHSKPLDWVRMLIANCTQGAVFDPCAGGGSTLAACYQLGRECVACEIDPVSAALALERIGRMGARWEEPT
jgi:hypothetical protein